MKYFIIALLLMFVVACDVNPSKMTQEYANDSVEKLTYTQDSRTGLCFAFITSRKTGSMDQTGLGMTWVPCTNKVLELIK